MSSTDSSSKSSKSSFWMDLLAGGVAGGVSKTVVAPFERVKLLLQVQAASTQIKSPYTSVLDCFVRVAKEQGMASFWRGNLANVVHYFPAQAINLATKDVYRRAFVGDTTKDNFWAFFLGNLASGGAAGATALAVVYPLDVARTRLATDVGVGAARVHRGIWHCVKDILATSGVKGLYQGFGLSVGAIVVYRAVLFGGYDTLRDVLLTDPTNAPMWQKWIVAQGVLSAAGVFAYPLDTVRRRMMIQVGRPDKLYANTWACWKTIYATEGGAKAFFKGASSNLLSGTGAALVLVLYDEVKASLEGATTVA
ncbi:Aste57867_11026 [Aphanomyces stellatus]|uniref:ADP/ATP translocase n=1 Tax=Aphanomyces stellatus TaxID=120398 RepID=A0A485KSK3_9STRA|nr:hypothetical protein As57867_010985 [Aphanomyces stellatus]VFT87894.1 Aste57867_11026 [Aphanomyces stellatus]